jgi:hypothetical protein
MANALCCASIYTTDCEISHSKSCKRVRGCGCSECENIKDCGGRCNDYCGEKCLIRQVSAVYGVMCVL